MTPGFHKSLEIRETKKGILTGNFIYYEDKKQLLFYDFYGRTINWTKIGFATSEWNIEDGYRGIPKPTIIAADGTMKEQGDQVLYCYINDRDEEVAILSSYHHPNLGHSDEHLQTDNSDIANLIQRSLVRNNPKRYFLLHDNAAGDVIFYLEGKGQKRKS